MGIKDRARKLVAEQLRPWLKHDVSPTVNVSVSEITVALPHLEFDAEALNGAGMGSSPLVISCMRVEGLELTFAPFRQPVLAAVVHGWHVDLEPRSAEDVYWEKKEETGAEQKRAASLEALDPQGAGVHTAAQGLAEGKAGTASLITQFITSLMLSSVRLDFRDVCLRIISHAQDGQRHVCSIPLSSLDFGGSNDGTAFTWSGGLMSAATAALGGLWKKSITPVSKYCLVKGFGMLVESQSVDGEGDRGRSKDSQQEHVNEDTDGFTDSAKPEVADTKVDSHVIKFEEWVLGIRFSDLAVDAMEFDVPEVTIGFEPDELNALQILTAQIQGPAQDAPSSAHVSDVKMPRDSDSEDADLSRTASALWKRGIEKAMDLSSHRRLSYTLQAGILRSRYSKLYESWLRELGWGRRQDDRGERNQSKKWQERITKLTEDISEIQTKLPVEAIALSRRLARHRAAAARNSSEATVVRESNSKLKSERLRLVYSSFQTFMASFWRVIVMSTILVQGKARGMSTWMSAARRLGVSEWKSMKGLIWKSKDNNDNVIFREDSIPVSTLESSPLSWENRTCTPENYFQLCSVVEERWAYEAPKRKWGMMYALKIRRGSITLAGRAIKALHKGEDRSSRPNRGELKLEGALIPAVHLSLQEIVLAYGSTGNSSGNSVSCGNLEAELFSVLPSHLSQRLAANLNGEVFQKEFSSLGRWTSKRGDKTLLLSSSPCPQREDNGSQTISEHPLAGDIYNKHWAWQERHLESWRGSWLHHRATEGASSGDSTTPHMDDNSRPCLIAESNNLDDDSTEDSYPGGLTKFSLALGQLDLILKGSSLSCVCLLLDQFSASQTDAEKKKADSNPVQPQSQNEPSAFLETFWDDSYSHYLDTCRDSMVSMIPKKSILFSAVVECPRIRLSATATELRQQEANREASSGVLNPDLNMEASVVLDFGRFDLAMWPPQKKEEVVEGVEESSHEAGSEFTVPKDVWSHEVESKLWLKSPPASAHGDFAERGRWDHEQVASNLYLCLEGVRLTLELRQGKAFTESPVLGPWGLSVEASLCSDQYSSLLSTTRSVSAAVGGKLSSLSVQAYIAEVTIVQQVVAFFTDVLNSRSGLDPVMVVEGGRTFMTLDSIAQEDLAEEGRDSDPKPDSPPEEEGFFIACSLTFAVELEGIRLVVGDSRHRNDHISSAKSNAGVQPTRRHDGRLQVEQRGRKPQSATDGDESNPDSRGWEQDPAGVVLGREIYILIQGVSLGASLGDEEVFCMYAGMKDSLIRLVNSASGSDRRDLAELRHEFFSPSMKSFTRLVLAEVSLEYLNMKVFGASLNRSAGDETVPQIDITLEDVDGDESSPSVDEEKGDEIDGVPVTDLAEIVQTSHFDPTSMAVNLNSDSVEQLLTEDERSEQADSILLEETSSSNHVRGEAFMLAVDVQVSKLLVTERSVDVLLAKVVLVTNGEDNLHLNFGVDRGFRKISVGSEGGLVLLHTAAVANLMRFCGDLGELVASPDSLDSDELESAQQAPSFQATSGFEESKASVYRSASAPAVSMQKGVKDFKRTASAPHIAEIPAPDNSELVPLPKFEGVVSSKLTGFSLVLAKQSFHDSEGVLFELEFSTMVELGDSVKKASFDLMRFTILGLPARAPGNSRKAPGRTGSRIPQFASFKLANGADIQSLSEQLNKPLSAVEEALETQTGGSGKSQTKTSSTDQPSSDTLSSSKDERVVATGNGGAKGNEEPPQSPASVGEQAEGFQKSLSDVNSFILERLTVHFAVEKVLDQDKVWKWTNAWHGQCFIRGLDVAITTSEIELLESVVAPLSSSGGAPKSTTEGEAAAASTATEEETEEVTDETDFEIPDGAIIAIKDIHEHCYLAAEEIPINKGQYRLAGVLHYTLVGDRALFRVKYDNPSTLDSKKDSWFSLLSIHAKDPHGEPFSVHCRHGSGVADISPAKDTTWEKWKFVRAERGEDENSTDVDIQKPNDKRLFHLVNQKNKSGIAFQENVPVIFKQPGNPFKVKIFKPPSQSRGGPLENLVQAEKSTSSGDEEVVRLVNSIPRITCQFDTFIFSVLHEAGSGSHLLPLLRIRIPGVEGVVHSGLSKTRTILQCGILLEHFDSQSSKWLSIVNPIETDLLYRARSIRSELAAVNGGEEKCPVAFFSRFRKVDVVFSEAALDACLFLIGALDLAGPFALRYSPVQANKCVVKNHTGVDAMCRFDQGSTNKVGGMIPSWHSDSFLVRHTTSRRDAGPAKVASSIALYLQKAGQGVTSPVLVSLGDSGVFAIKTRLQTEAGQKKASGPLVVVDVSRRSEDGIKVTVSPMVRIGNKSGLPIELRCMRDSAREESAVVELEDGDTIDDTMAAFDAINLAGGLRKALKSLTLGNYCLSLKPTTMPSTAQISETENSDEEDLFDWSDAIKGAKPVRSSGLLDKLQYNFKSTVKANNVQSSFGVVFCPAKLKSLSKKKPPSPDQDVGLHFLVRTTCREVPISRPRTEPEKEQQPGKLYSVVAWQQQQEILLLPTVRVMNLTTGSISIVLITSSEARRMRSGSQKHIPISSFGTECLYVDLGDLHLTVRQEDLSLSSRPISIGVGSKEFSKTSKNGRAKDIEMELDFGDGLHSALVNIRRGADGVLEVVILTRYTLQNDSHVDVLCCSARQQSSWWGGLRPSRNQEADWPNSGSVLTIEPKARVSWFERSTTVLFKRTEPSAEAALLDLESVSGSMEISLRVHGAENVDSTVQLGVLLRVPTAGDSNPSYIIVLVPRYVVANDSSEAILVCQDGFQDTDAMLSLAPGESSALDVQELTGQNEKKGGNEEVGPDVLLKVRFRPLEMGWKWSGPVCAAAIGSFSVKIRRPQPEDSKEGPSQKPQSEDLLFAVLDVQEKESTLIMSFKRQPVDAIPYRLENALRSAAITYNQQGIDSSEVLEAGGSVGYVWDDLGESHTLVVHLAGTALQDHINPDKLRSWKSFRASRGNTMGPLRIPFLNDLGRLAMYGDRNEDDDGLPSSTGGKVPVLGYEVYADGPTRVVRICEERDGRVERHWQSDVSSPKMEVEMRIPIFTISIVEPGKQPTEAEKEEDTSLETVAYVPVICLRLTNVLVEARITSDYTFCQVKAERLDVDCKWNGAPLAAMVRGHGQDRFETGHTVLHTAIVMSNLATNPIQLKYASVLLQAIDLNLDEETLMKLVPFYRLSLSESTAPSRQIYFERFEIHPIKIVGSFLPGNPRADYSSGQETLRALLHSVIKVPTVRGATVELNGVLLSNALLTFKQLALKCAQHYSWYSMRAIYIARGSKLLPPGFASLFDDSAASSLDVFFDPSSGSIDLQGLTLGMFGMLRRGLRKKGKGGGTQRYLGDLQHTMKAAGSNILFAAVTEVSDSVLKGADANGFDGVLTGFRRGILNVAMKPSVLRGAVVQGGSTRRIKLDRIVGANEAYIEGYLQAMLDALFKQSYVHVKVMDDQVLLKNLPPNTTLMEEMVQCARDFLIGEGLLAGESSAAALSSLRRLQGEDDRRVGPTVVALCEQLLVIIVVRSMRRQTVKVLRQNNITIIGSEQPEIRDSSKSEKEDEEQKEQPRQGFFEGINFKRAVTGFALSSALAYVDGRICRHIPNPLVRRVVSGFLLSFVE